MSSERTCRERLGPALERWGWPRLLHWHEGTEFAAAATALPDGAILLAIADADHSSTASAHFAHVAAFAVLPVNAVLVSSACHPEPGLARIGHASATLWLTAGSDWPLPAMPQGLIESAVTVPESVAAARSAESPPPQTQLIGLAERLMAMETKLIAAEFRASRLEYRLSQSWPGNDAGTGSGAFDVPRERHQWKLAEDAGLDAASLAPYDRRVDDPVILEARAGEAFFARWGLLGDAPDFAGAAESLAAAAPVSPDPPEVSIVIPVYRQLAYTLNCLDSLLRHHTRFSFEIIVVDDGGGDSRLLASIDRVRYHPRAGNGGFIVAANDGAALAHGRYLVLLNNDTRVVAGWLDALIGSFAEFPVAGLIGSKLHYPDGSLQEAGGIIWRDGSCWNYGQKDDPNRPQYSYARQADYISGCSIAIKTSVWREFGGFDPHYAPAYCEDADLCLRLAESGHQIWFQPASRVVHYEGRTAGTDTGKGIKSYQLINLKKLYLRWRERLLDHRRNGKAPFFERERGVKQHLLVVDATAPTPSQDAGSVQTMVALRAARALGYKVHFVPQDNFLFDPATIGPLLAIGIDCAYAPYELGFEHYLRRYGFLFDVILVYRVAIFERTIADIEKFAPHATLLYHVADLHHLRIGREAARDDDPFLAAQAEKIQATEFSLARSAHATITHSDYEAALLAAAGARAVIWPLSMEISGTAAGFAPRRDIAFLGNYRHPPNVDAVRYFVARIWPLVATALDGARFIIAGANPTAEVSALAAADIVVTGEIADLRDLFDQVRVSVVPLRAGAGVKGKVITALSYGVPVVSTPIGVEGTGLVPEEQVLIAETPEAIAAQILRLYRDEALWRRLSEAGLAVVRKRFSPDRGPAILAQAIERGTRHRLGLEPAP